MKLVLVSHELCPYVQRAAIVLHEKGAAFERRWIDLARKPAWFRALSPLGKTPVLLVGEVPLFESSVICEYLEEVLAPRMHPAHPLERARHRAWVEFASALLNTIGAFYNAADATSFNARREELRNRFAQLQPELHRTGPYFSGARFTIVDAAFAPVFRYFDVFSAMGMDGLLDAVPRVRAWRAALSERESVRLSAHEQYPQLLETFLLARGSELSRRLEPRLRLSRVGHAP